MNRKIYQLKATWIITLAHLLFTSFLFAQVPQKMSYQAVIRNSSNTLIPSTTIGMQISILKDSLTGAAVYVEKQTPSTNANGLVSLEIGTGTAVLGTFASINWANGPYFIKTETDPTGGTTYSITGTNELMSVPYALFSANGNPGPQGPAGTNGTNGVSITNSNVIHDSLYITLSNGQILNAGYVKGDTGATGATGPQGPVGPSGSVGLTHFLGEQFGGGVIFYLWKDTQMVEHGLIVDVTELSNSQAWSNVLSYAAAISTWDGLNNSNAIIGQAGHTNSAAALCLNSTNGGQTDWYLPSIDELSLLWQNRFHVEKSLSSIAGATSLLNYPWGYWSSNEVFGTLGLSFDFIHGQTISDGKNVQYPVRAVRSF